MTNTQRADRTHIGIFGRCNVGKSQLLNAIAGQEIAVVSSTEGTTTDPVYKSMELLPLGPVVLIDTAGLDDTTLVAKERIQKTNEVLRKIDIGLLVINETEDFSTEEKSILENFKSRNITYIIVQNKLDIASAKNPIADISVSAFEKIGIESLKEKIANLNITKRKYELLDGIVNPEEIIVLVTPIDKGAPKGRLILPQQQTIRGILDNHSASIVVQPEQVEFVLGCLKEPPALVITDSQVFGTVGKSIPSSIPLTSFSILFARYKGILSDTVNGILTVKTLNDGDKILIAEGCSHHRQCEDIGTVKIPKWLSVKTGKNLNFEFCSGGEFPDNLGEFSLVVHCGGCMLNDKEMIYRLSKVKEKNIPITNYGILISYIHGTLKRSIEIFPELEI